MILPKIRRSLRELKRGARKRQRIKAGLTELSEAVSSGLPEVFARGLQCVIGGMQPPDVAAAFARIEKIRVDIAARGDEQIPVFYSPKPSADYRTVTAPGDCKTFSAQHLAMGTSVPADVGQMIHLIARDAGAGTLIEFGSCVGIGASYLAAVPCCKRFITMEASTELSKIAADSVRSVNPRAEVYNQFFSEALDSILPTLENGIDFAWIDGHHEKTATIHYFQRIRPHLNSGAIVAFDDIYWSQDMLDGWNELRVRRGFSHAIDAGSCGLCLFEGQDAIPEQWSFSSYIGDGAWKPLKPAGWTESQPTT